MPDMTRPAQDLRGNTYHLLTVVGPPQRVSGRTRYACLCSCGQRTQVEQSALKAGKVKSCGCLKAVGYHVTHGMSGTPTYSSWERMHSRCRYAGDSSYPRYGAAGIVVCERWSRFENFLEDMGERPPGHTLERENNTKGYSPDNCRWATPVEQAKNRRQTTYVQIGEELLMFSEAVRKYGKVSYHVAKNRVNRDGWDAVRAITTPAKGTK